MSETNRNKDKNYMKLDIIKIGHCECCRYIAEQKIKGVDISLLLPFKNKCKCNGRRFDNYDKSYCLMFGDHIRYVTKDKFREAMGKTIIYNRMKVKTQLERDLAVSLLDTWRPQGLSSLFNGVENTSKNFDVLLNSINTLVTTFNDSGAPKTLGALKNNLTYVLSDICVAFMNIINIMLNDFTLINLGTFLVNMYQIFIKCKLLFLQDQGQEEVQTQPSTSGFVPQFGESIVLGFLSTYLPTRLMQSIRHAGLFSNNKVLDDYSVLFNLFSDIRSYFDLILEHDKMPSNLKNILIKFLDCTPFNKFASILYRIRECNTRVRSTRTILLDGEFQERCLEIRDEIRKIDYSARVGKNRVIDADVKVFLSFCKTIESYRSSIRIEPNMFVFEGKPGIGKTYCMNILAKTFGVPIYNHIIPDKESGKDFYDDYDNEDIYVMDDIGQMGVSQWSPVMNFISSAKMPLMCAQAEYKNTKFLTSRLFLATTNQIEGLNVLRCDGIADVNALFRRVKIFKYCDDGYVTFRCFNLETNSYEEGFGKDKIGYERWCKKHNFEFRTRILRTSDEYYIWLRSIIDYYLDKSRGIASLQMDQIELIRSSVEEKFKSPFLAQSYDWEEILTTLKEYAFSCISDLSSSIIENLRDFFSLDNLVRCLLGASITLILQQFIGRLFTYFSPQCLTPEVDPFLDMKQSVERNEVTECSLGTAALKKQVFVCRLHGINIDKSDMNVYTSIFISSDNIILPYHSIYMFDKTQDIFATVYSNFDKKTLIYDHVPVKLAFESKNDDVAICKLPSRLPTILKDFSNHFKAGFQGNTPCHLITPYGVINVEANKVPGVDNNYKHKTGSVEFEGSFSSMKDCFYSIQADALCGSIILDRFSNVLGMHIAGNKKRNVGVSKVWSNETITKIGNILRNRTNPRYNVEIAEAKYSDVSVVKLENDKKFSTFVNKKTTMVESPIHGIFDVQRKPANLNSLGDGTIKELAKKNYAFCADVNINALNFAKRYVNQLIPPFEKLDDTTVIKGNDFIKPLNKDTSAGFGYGSDKSKYINFEDGVVLEKLSKDIATFEQCCVENGELPIELCISVDTLKDELRDLSKVDKPRVFKMANLLQTFLCKRYFGDMLTKLHDNRWSNGIMIGCNPFVDFDKIVKYVENFGDNVFDGDYKQWDANMLPQFQFALKNMIIGKFQGTKAERDVAETLLNIGINTPTVNMNELLMTTHGLPSGWYLTADFNSLINKMYIAYVYYILYKENNGGKEPMIDNFTKDVLSFVYGDDVLVAVSDNVKHYMNGPSFGKIMEATGVCFTPAHKGEWDYEYKSIYSCTFLKRGFVFHPYLGKVVCPLDLKTIRSTLNYISDKNKKNEITMDKLHNFQREIFLHYDVYDQMMSHVKEYCEAVCFPFVILGIDYLSDLYLNEPSLYASHINLQY